MIIDYSLSWHFPSYPISLNGYKNQEPQLNHLCTQNLIKYTTPKEINGLKKGVVKTDKQKKTSSNLIFMSDFPSDF